MKYSIKRISPHSAGKLSAAIFGTFSLLFLPLFLIANLAAKASAQSEQIPSFFGWLFLLFPILYALMGYVMTAGMCTLYNIYSKFVGRLEIHMEVESIEKIEQ